jgi:hypothetical protein
VSDGSKIERSAPPRPIAARLRAWAELTRISNLPTVVSNAFAGFGIAWVQVRTTPQSIGFWAFWSPLALATAAVSLTYLGGMILNDVCDVETDRRERPGRPIPSGRVSIRAARRTAAAMLLLGPPLLLVSSLVAAVLGLALALLVVAYNTTHTRWVGSVVILGACRSLVYVTTAAAVQPDFTVIVVAAYLGALLGVYTALFSIVARGEAGGKSVRWPAIVIPFLLLPFTLPALQRGMGRQWPHGWVLTACVAFSLWTSVAAVRMPHRLVPAVLMWLSGICLFDAWVLTTTGNAWWVSGALVCFGLTVWSHRRILGT